MLLVPVDGRPPLGAAGGVAPTPAADVVVAGLVVVGAVVVAAAVVAGAVVAGAVVVVAGAVVVVVGAAATEMVAVADNAPWVAVMVKAPVTAGAVKEIVAIPLPLATAEPIVCELTTVARADWKGGPAKSPAIENETATPGL